MVTRYDEILLVSGESNSALKAYTELLLSIKSASIIHINESIPQWATFFTARNSYRLNSTLLKLSSLTYVCLTLFRT
jgi:hypothetical protein